MGKANGIVGTVLLGLAFISQMDQVLAQDASNSQLAEVVVTAQRKSERLQDVPAAVSAFSAQDLEQHEVRGLADVVPFVPSATVTFPYGDGGPPNFSIRGITSTDYTSVQSKPVAIYMDGAVRNTQLYETMPIFDADRVEVLRGPQGALYGKNATAGAVNIISIRPTFDTNGYITAGYGNFDRRSAQGAFQTPLVDHVLAARVAFTYTKDDGVIKSLVPGVGNFAQTDIFAMRATLYLEPSSDFNATLRYSHMTSGGRDYVPLALPTNFSIFPNLQSVPGINRAGVGYYETQSLTAPHRDILMDEFNLSTEWAVSEHYALTSVSAFAWGKWNDISDGGGGLPLINWDTADYYTSGAHQFDQEFLISSKLSGPLNWLGGVSYTQDRIVAAFQYAFLADPRCAVECNFGLGNGIGYFENAVLEQKRSSYSGFLRGEYEITPEVKLSAGVRQSHDHLDVPSYNASIGDTSCGNCIPTIVNVSKNVSFNNTSAEAGLDWKMNPNILLYGTFKQGYRTGAVNAQAFLSPSEVTIAPPETVNSFEAGIKSTSFNHALTLDLAAFSSDYKNQQIISAVVSGASAIFPLVSVPKSRIRGLELEANARPIPEVTFILSLSFLDPKYLQGTISGVNAAGNQIAGAAKINGSAGVELALPADGDHKVHLNINETYTSKIYNDTAETELIAQPVQWLTNGRLSYDTERYSVAAWGKNIFNLKSFTYGLNLLPTQGFDYLIRIMPRTYGVEATYRF